MRIANLSNFKHHKDQHLLRYQAIVYKIILILCLITLIFGATILYISVTIEDIKSVLIEPDIMSLALITAVIITVLSLSLAVLIIPKYIKSCSHKHAWYLCFQPETISINVRHCRYLNKLSSHDKTCVIINKNNIDWIRKALPQTLGTRNYDPYYIEIKLQKDDWENVKKIIQREQEEMRRIKANNNDFIFTLCDEQILRIRTDICYWPENVTKLWKDFEYTISKDYRIPLSKLM